MIQAIRWPFFVFGVVFFSFGISLAIKVKYLGIHPWDVLNVGLYEKFGLTIGTWNIIVGLLLIGISWILDKSYIRIGTFLNALLVGSCVDFFLWLDVIPKTDVLWLDIPIMLAGIIVMGIGGGIYNAAGVGSGPRDGFMLSIADKTGAPISRVRIITETGVLIIGLILGGPVFIVTFIFTFVQSPIFQFTFLKCKKLIERLETPKMQKQMEDAVK